MAEQNPLIGALNWRYATKKFDPTKKVSEADLKELLEAARLSASSLGVQPWKFVVVTNPATREEIKKSSWGQAQVTDASHLIVLCARMNMDEKYVDEYMASIAKTRGITTDALKGFKDMIMGSMKSKTKEQLNEWSKRQVYIALGTLLAAAALKRIDACPMEGFDPAGVGKILGLEKQNLEPVAFCPVGYRAADDSHAAMKKSRFPIEKVRVDVK